MAINFSKHINTLSLKSQEKESLIIDRFMQGLVAATTGYKSIMNNSNLCIHYHMKSRDVGVKEMFATGLKFYKQFLSDVISVSDVNLTAQYKFKVQIFTELMQKLIRRLFRLHK